MAVQASNLFQRNSWCITIAKCSTHCDLYPCQYQLLFIIYFIHVYQVKQYIYSPVLMRLLHISSYNFKYNGMMRTQFVWIKGHIDGSVDLLVGMEDHSGFLVNPWCIREGRRDASKVDGHQVSRKSLSLPSVHQQVSISERDTHHSRSERFQLSQFLELLVQFQEGVNIVAGSFSLSV